MMNLLADVTADGMKSWSVTEWTLFITAVTTGLTTLIASIAALLKSSRAETRAGVAADTSNRAQSTAESAHATAARAEGIGVTNSERITNVSRLAGATALAAMPPAPTPEAITRAAATQPENP